MKIVAFPSHLSAGVVERIVDEMEEVGDREFKPIFWRHMIPIAFSARKAGVPEAEVEAEIARLIEACIATMMLRRAARQVEANQREGKT